jgi:membrane-bound acyltransferase YfiQ involved in biofilm formation
MNLIVTIVTVALLAYFGAALKTQITIYGLLPVIAVVVPFLIWLNFFMMTTAERADAARFIRLRLRRKSREPEDL